MMRDVFYEDDDEGEGFTIERYIEQCIQFDMPEYFAPSHQNMETIWGFKDTLTKEQLEYHYSRYCSPTAADN